MKTLSSPLTFGRVTRVQGEPFRRLLIEYDEFGEAYWRFKQAEKRYWNGIKAISQDPGYTIILGPEKTNLGEPYFILVSNTETKDLKQYLKNRDVVDRATRQNRIHVIG